MKTFLPTRLQVLSRKHFNEWGERYLDSDPDSRTRTPAGVKTPLGPFSEIIKAWHGQLGYDREGAEHLHLRFPLILHGRPDVAGEAGAGAKTVRLARDSGPDVG